MAIRDRITQLTSYLVKQIKCSKGGILIGRVTSAGPAQEIELGTGLSFNGKILNATSSFDDLDDKPTTLAGYGITDAFVAPLVRTADQGPPHTAVITLVGASAHVGVTIARTGKLNGKPRFVTGIYEVSWDGVSWKFKVSGTNTHSAIGTSYYPWDADWAGGTISFVQSGLPETSVGRTCLVGDAASINTFRTFLFCGDGDVWIETTPGVIKNDVLQTDQKIFPSGADGYETIVITHADTELPSEV